MTYATEPTTQVARKGHRCSWCGQHIEAGETYRRYRSFAFGDASTVKMHPECFDAMTDAAREEGGWIEWTPGDGERPIKESA